MKGLAIAIRVAVAFALLAPSGAQSEEYWPSLPGMTKLSKRDYAPRAGLAAFSARDIPQRLPRRNEASLSYVVRHSGGESTVEFHFSRNVNRAAFSRSGKGEAVPVSVRLSPSKQGFALYQKKRHRRLDLRQNYRISGKVYRKSNRKSAVALTREVLGRTFCNDGTVTENHDMGDFVSFYGRRSNARSPEGFGVLPGVVVNFRCSRWRAK